MVTQPQVPPARPAVPSTPPPKPNDKVAKREGEPLGGDPPIPPTEAGTDPGSPYDDSHYDTPNSFSPETIADEQRKRSDAMGPPADEAKKAAAKNEKHESITAAKK